MNEKQTKKQLDLSMYISKYAIPVLERKWIVLGCFFSGLILAVVVNIFIKPEFISQTTLMVDEPRSEISRVKQDYEAPKRAEGAYVAAEEEKLKSSSFAAEVLKILPDTVKNDLKKHIGLFSQIIKGVKNLVGIKSKAPSPLAMRRELMGEIKKRIEIKTSRGLGLIWITATTFSQEIAPLLAKSYVDVCLATNLEENKEGISGERKFAEKQRNQAYQQLQKAEQTMLDFKKHYEIPGDFEVARDIQIQIQLERLKSVLSMEKEHFIYLDKIYFENQMKEAGITGNIRVIAPPTFPLIPSRKTITRITVIIIIGALMFGVGIVLLLDFIKGSIRHESDIINVSNIPVLGHIPKVIVYSSDSRPDQRKTSQKWQLLKKLKFSLPNKNIND
jgi:uncharacterized protein involved in exopolysaccharide biosynthesis